MGLKKPYENLRHLLHTRLGLFYLGCFSLALLLLGIIGVISIFMRPAPPDFEVASSKALSDVSLGQGEKKAVLKAITANVRYLQRTEGPHSVFAWDGMNVTKNDMIKAMRTLIEALSKQPQEGQPFKKTLKNTFVLLKIRKDVLVTGYFVPKLKASRSPTPSFTTPVLAMPKDLITVRLKRFTKTPGASHLVLRGRVRHGELIPYYTRQEIEASPTAEAIAFLKDPLDLFMLQVQGSGILEFGDGNEVLVRYAGDNGHPYTSVGKILIERGILSPEEASWQGIARWYREHPEEGKKILAQNRRYIFFKKDPNGDKTPIGAAGEPLVPFHSIAVDPRELPIGAVFILKVAMPDKKRFCSLVASQDKGAAIKGLYHVDLFLGTGKDAGDLAGRLKAKGELYLLVPRDTKTPDTR